MGIALPVVLHKHADIRVVPVVGQEEVILMPHSVGVRVGPRTSRCLRVLAVRRSCVRSRGFPLL